MKPLLILGLLASQTGCVYVSTTGDPDDDFGGDVITRTSTPDTFQQLVIDGAFRDVSVEVCADCAPGVTVTGDERLVEEVIIAVDDGVLEIGHERQFVVTDGRLEVRVKTSKLEGVTLTSGADVSVDGIDSETFEIVNSGSGGLTVQGASVVLDITATGWGEVHAYDVEADAVQVIVSGSGDVEVCAMESLRGTLTGSGDLFYDCGPAQTDLDTTGSGRVSIR